MVRAVLICDDRVLEQETKEARLARFMDRLATADETSLPESLAV